MKSPVGQRIKNIIEELNLSTSEFCSKMNVASPVVYNILNGRNKPGYDLMGKIINTFNVDPNYLLLGTGEMFISNVDNNLDKNIKKVNDSHKRRTEIMEGDFGGSLGGTPKNDEVSESTTQILTNKSTVHESNDIAMKRKQNDIIESNKDFFSEYSHGLYSDFPKDSYEYLQIRYYEPMSMHHLKMLYSSELEEYKRVYTSYEKQIKVLHYLEPVDFMLEKFPLVPDFKEIVKMQKEDWGESFENLKDEKLEIILKILSLKESIDHISWQLTKLIDYMFMYKDMIHKPKTLK